MNIAYHRPDGRLWIAIATPYAERARRELSEAEYQDYVIKKAVYGLHPDATDVEILPDDWTPPTEDRTFRNAWVKSKKGVIDIDIAKARAIHRDHLRKARDQQLTALDVTFMIAVEKNDNAKKNEIAAKKQRLRDAPAHPAIDAAKTPEELKALTLDVLANG